MGHAVREYGATDEQPFDYPDAAAEVAERIQKGEAEFGVLICGTGIGMSIAANRFKGIRAAPCCDIEVSKLAREHNFANILCLGARLIEPDEAMAIFDTFLSEPESTEPRHQRRVMKMDTIGDAQPAGRSAP
jgi:ribose 5-phosphate isomerase B